MRVSTNEAIKLLRTGNVIGIPTDTVYGFCSLKADIEQIYEIKNRDRSKKLIQMIYSIEQIQKLTTEEIPASVKQLMVEKWPGKTTIIFPINGELTSFRIPDEPNLLKLLKALDEPIYTTSANVSTEPACLTAAEFNDKFPTIELLDEEIEIEKSGVASEIIIYEKNEFKKVR